jgi:hypothetical protein
LRFVTEAAFVCGLLGCEFHRFVNSAASFLANAAIAASRVGS